MDWSKTNFIDLISSFMQKFHYLCVVLELGTRKLWASLLLSYSLTSCADKKKLKKKECRV